MSDDKAKDERWSSVTHHWVSIWGKVIDGVTRKPIVGAEVRLTAVPSEFKRTLELLAEYDGEQWEKRIQRPDKTRTRADGIFYFLDLPDGEYEVRATLLNCGKRYGGDRQKKKVSAAEQKENGLEKLKAMWLGLALRPTAIHGRITNAAKRAGLMMAEVRLKGSGERAFSDARGEFTIGPIEASAKSERTLECFAQGYTRQERAHVVVAEPGDLLELKEIELEPVPRH